MEVLELNMDWLSQKTVNYTFKEIKPLLQISSSYISKVKKENKL